MLFVILMTLAAGAQMAHAAKGGRSDFYQKCMSPSKVARADPNTGGSGFST